MKLKYNMHKWRKNWKLLSIRLVLFWLRNRVREKTPSFESTVHRFQYNTAVVYTLWFICSYWVTVSVTCSADLQLHYAGLWTSLGIYLIDMTFFFWVLTTNKKLIGNWWQSSLSKIIASKLDWTILKEELIYAITPGKEDRFLNIAKAPLLYPFASNKLSIFSS